MEASELTTTPDVIVVEGVEGDVIAVDVGWVPAAPAPEPEPPEPWHFVGDAGEPPFNADWSNFGGSFERVAFRKDPAGQVWLKGLAKQTGAPSPPLIFTLPTGYRPSATRLFGTYGADVAAVRLDVAGDGSVTRTGSGSPSLEGIVFDSVAAATKPGEPEPT